MQYIFCLLFHVLLKFQNNGVSGKTHAWITSWLKNRSQLIVIDGEKSDEAQVHPGAPQGNNIRLFIPVIH